MRGIQSIGLAALITLTLSGWDGLAVAQPCGAGRGMCGGRGGAIYDPTTVTTVSGKVSEVTRYEMGGRLGPGVHLTLETEKQTLDVHLGPARYVDEQTPKINVGDHVTITGSRITLQGKPALIAAEVKENGATLKLRDVKTGVPQWSGGGGRGRGRGPAGR